MEPLLLQKAARAAFSSEDWRMLCDDSSLLQNFTKLSHIEDVEKFVFEAYDLLRNLRECHPSDPASGHISGTSVGIAQAGLIA